LMVIGPDGSVMKLYYFLKRRINLLKIDILGYL